MLSPKLGPADRQSVTASLRTQNRLVFFIIRMNSSSFTSPSPSLSASSIISCRHGSSVRCLTADPCMGDPVLAHASFADTGQL